MDLNTYQTCAMTTAKYPGRGTGNLTYPTLGLCGEAGEVAEKVKKLIRDDHAVLSEERRSMILLEMGDILWYLAALATELGATLETIAALNLEKLHSRHSRGVVSGDGDLR